MKKIQVIYALNLLGRNSFCETLSEFTNYQLIYFVDLIKESLRINLDPLISKMKSYVDNGKIIPPELLNDYAINLINDSENDQILVGYPNKPEQYELFINSLKELNIRLTSSWIIDYENIEEAVKNEIEIKGEVHCKKVDWTFDDEKKIIMERLSIFKNDKKEIEERFNQKFKKIVITENDNLKDYYLKQIKMHNKV